MALPVPRPEGQTDSIFLSVGNAFVHPSDTCPDYDMIDAEGREGALALQAAIAKAGGAPPDVEAEEIETQMLDLDYWIRGSITVNRVTGTIERWYSDFLEEWFGPNIVGDFTLHMEIYDPHHETVVKQGQTSWSGTINSREGLQATEKLAKSFGSLSVILHDYERKPIKATVEPEYDPVLAGEQVTLRLTDIMGDGGQPQPWWRIFVKADQGKITNGEPQDEYRWFRVGKGSPVEVQYQAPASCQGNEITEKVTVKNTCNIEEHFVGMPKDDIATKDFKVLCTSYELEYDETYSWDFGFVQITIPFRGRVPFHAVRSPGDSTQILLEGGGEVRAPVQGQVGGACTFGGEMVETYKIGGTLEPQKDAPPILNLEVTESEGGDAALQCPGGPKIPFSYMEPRSYPVEMMGKEGVIYEVDVPYGTGTLKLTLHQR